ncbi:MAG: hypothetical protein V1804_01120 [Patescibacteria group bacterium]
MKKELVKRDSLIFILAMAFFLVGCAKNNQKNVPEDKEIGSAKNISNQENVANANSKFGFLVDARDPQDVFVAVQKTGAAWLRPHVGSFIWGEIEKSPGNLNFSQTDALVKKAQQYNFNLLITIWPYASWQYQDAGSRSRCDVGEESGFSEDLPRYRCNPTDWNFYQKWLSSAVERYDGDGQDDMPGLAKPIKYWEIGNEPDLKDPGLTFYKGTPQDYAELLQKSFESVKKADSEAKVVIAGAAGTSPDFAKFWNEFFGIKDIGNYFDIGNIHAISGGNRKDLNVSDYQRWLSERNIKKPVWVTEAEGKIKSKNVQDNAKELNDLVDSALKAGAEKIFFTHASLTGAQDRYNPQVIVKEAQYYKNIIQQ